MKRAMADTGNCRGIDQAKKAKIYIHSNQIEANNFSRNFYF